MPKLLVDVTYFTKEDLFDGSTDPAVTINGKDYIDEEPQTCWDALTNANLIKDDAFVIPAGTEVVEVKQFGGATQYELQTTNNVNLILDAIIEDEEIG